MPHAFPGGRGTFPGQMSTPEEIFDVAIDESNDREARERATDPLQTANDCDALEESFRARADELLEETPGDAGPDRYPANAARATVAATDQSRPCRVRHFERPISSTGSELSGE